MPQSHEDYDRERQRRAIAEQARKLEQQRQEALRRAKDAKDREALNAFYDNRAKANQRRGGKKDACMVTLLIGASVLGAAATAIAQAVKAFT